MRLIPTSLLILALLAPGVALARRDKDDAAKAAEEQTGKLKAATFAGLALRPLGPALTSGRVIDIAVHPEDARVWYVAAASGGVWKTVNAGVTWTPVFDGEGSYSIGCVVVDPANPHVVWVGTGENNSQRSVGYGDGVYKSRDGGKTWQRMGLERSEHVGKIVIDPRDSDVVYVAAQGPLWSSGGDRGLYKTSDGGATWKRVLAISDDTGVTDVVLDPRDPDVLVAASYQRRRRVWTLIDGGPESAVHKSTDGGATWRQLAGGLPKGDVGRIGLALSPADSDVLYAVIEAVEGEGFYRSLDRGESWEKRSDYVSGSPQYYQELIPDPHDRDRVYSNDVWLQVTEDGGKTFRQVPETYKHVDNHSLWIDPEDADHLIAGCDGGLYETFDRGEAWRFVANLPITQFYKVEVDDDLPFYNVYGGTQDNFSLGGPSRTVSHHGIVNSDWFVTLGGDGFQTRVDPTNPDVVYSQLQYGNLVRFDRASGEATDVQPQPGPDEEPLRWNWDAPLIISPHSPTRLYFAAQRLFRSDDRGDAWRAVSGDLSRRLDRDQLEVMGKVWSIDAVARHRSTSPYGNVVSLDESPLAEGLIYAGTDDGLVQVTADGGETWRKVESFPGVPELTYVNDLAASRHGADVVYAAFNNHKSGDFKPYLLKSGDRGATWASIAGDPVKGGLPERGSVYTVVEDPVRPDLLFAGTELGVWFTLDGGAHWMELTGGMPTIAVRDLEIQERESDLVLATFGRGFYVLDDYSPLRHVDAEALEQEAILFPVKDALIFNESYPLGVRGKSFQGDAFYAAPNPPAGAVFTYYLAQAVETRQERRRKAEKELAEKGEAIPIPPWDEVRAEEREEAPAILLTLSDADGHVIRRLTGPAKAGFHRVTWDLRFPPPDPATVAPWRGNAFQTPPMGPRVVPDTYRVTLARRVDGEETPLGEPREFAAVPLGNLTVPAPDKDALLAFQRQAARLQRAVLGAGEVVDEARERLKLIRKAVDDTAGADPELGVRARELEERLTDLGVRLEGDDVLRRHQQPQLPSIRSRVGRVTEGWTSRSPSTATQQASYDAAADAFEELLGELRVLVEEDLKRLQDDLEAAGAPWTPGRVPSWTRE
ncbi:MAG TPA: glycosyl hydrolase [Thermoanaerobaculia bacterium]